MSRRLLHYGASTTQILDVYINTINAFRVVDPTGVLLHFIVGQIRSYLKTRQDLAKILIMSFLADTEDEDGNMVEHDADICVAIAAEMKNAITTNFDAQEDLDFSYDWVPEPMDTAADYRKVSSDLMAYLLNLFDSIQSFISELQSILGERLLKSDDTDFLKERRLIELLQHRYGKADLQACEVMLHDVTSSKQLNAAIRWGMGMSPFSAEVLSHRYWPPQRSESFVLPRPVEEFQSHYSAAFERIKYLRKLDWVQVLGKVQVDLDLEDRSIEGLVVHTWQAAVIYAFENEDEEAGSTESRRPATKTAKQLMQELKMSETLVRNALAFWIGEKVLVRTKGGEDAYAVLERQESGNAQSNVALAAQQAADEAAAAEAFMAAQAAQAAKDEQLKVYEQAITFMLTNRGSVPFEQMNMMLGMIVQGQGGVVLDSEELKGLLEKLVGEARVERSGNVFRLRRSE